MARLGDFAVGDYARLEAVNLTASSPGRVIDTRGFRNAQSVILVEEPGGGGGSDTVIVKFQHSPDPLVSETINGYNLIDDGSEKLRDGANSNIELGIPFTPGSDRTIWSIKLQLSRLGAPALAAGGIPNVRVSIQADAAGSPSGTDLFVSRGIDANSIDTIINEIKFYFDAALDLIALNPYWIVIRGAYDVSATDCIQVHYNSVISACKHYDAAWALLINKNLWFVIEHCIFADAAIIPIITITEATILNPVVEGLIRTEIDLDMLYNMLRSYYTVSGATWTLAHGMYLGDPKIQPAI